MRARLTITALCLGVLAGATLLASGERGSEAAAAKRAAAPAALPAPPTFNEALFSRIVSTRVRHTRLKPVRNSNARRIGRALASLRPTWVTGLFRFAKGQYPDRDEARAWREVRRIVRTTSPNVQFDVVLNALQYESPAGVRKMMNRVRRKLDPDGWFFDFHSTAVRKFPRSVKAGVISAHAHGEWIGGNVFGISMRRPVPARVDYFSVQDAKRENSSFYLDLPAVARLATLKPVMYHLNSEPGDPRSGGCRFINHLDTRKRRALIRRRAAQQVRYGFRVSYPAFYPQCLRQRRGSAFLHAYNAFRDPPMARQISELLDRYDFEP